MKRIIVSSLLAASVMFGSVSDLDNLTKINNEQLKQNVWHMGDKSFDISIIKDLEMKSFFVSLLVSKPAVATIIVDHFQAKTCKNDLSFFNSISIKDIKDFVASKQYETLSSYIYAAPYQYENIVNNVNYLMCGTNSFTPDIRVLKLSNINNDSSAATSIKATLMTGHYFLPEFNFSSNSMYFQGIDSCIYSGSAKYSMYGSEKVDVILDKKSCVVNGSLVLTDIKGYAVENQKSGISAIVDYSNDTVAFIPAGKTVDIEYIK